MDGGNRAFKCMATSKSSVPSDDAFVMRAMPGSFNQLSESDTASPISPMRTLLGAATIVLASAGVALMRPPHAMANGTASIMPHATHTTTAKATKTPAASIKRTSATAAAAKTGSSAGGVRVVDMNHFAYQTTKVVHER